MVVWEPWRAQSRQGHPIQASQPMNMDGDIIDKFGEGNRNDTVFHFPGE